MIRDIWGQGNERDFSSESTPSNIRMMDEDGQKGLLFSAIRANDLSAIRNILQVNQKLLNAKMFGYEGSDVKEIIKNSKTRRCYFYTGQERDGYFYPFHVCTEAGHKTLTMLLHRAGANEELLDYRGCTAEEKCTGQASHAFFEIRGFKFESSERYQGKLDKNGLRHGQGVVFFKPEGYTAEEKQLYRGSFKNGLYHGHGTLYWPGTEMMQYAGRFKAGLRHGRGIEFDAQQTKIYQGNFRDNKREGRGEEFCESQRVYKGEFSNDVKHGFGVAFMGDNGKYFGRFENNLWSGVGVYVLANGDRYEGMYFNSKLDGAGSSYLKENGVVVATHALWQGNRKLATLEVPFVPTAADLPDDTNQSMLAEIMKATYATNNSTAEEEPAVEQLLFDTERVEEQKYIPSVYRNFTYFDVEQHAAAVSRGDLWKVQLGKYLKLPLKDAKLLGLSVPESHILLGKGAPEDEGAERAGEEEEDDGGEEDMDEITGYHFVECTTLFVAYVYVNSAAKVFEDRLVKRGMITEYPDFEAVYHLVIDAVDVFNDRWEVVYKQQQQAQLTQQMAANEKKPYRVSNNNKAVAIAALSSQLEQNSAADGALNPDGTVKILERRQMFMTEKEKKDELIQRQRAELAIKKGSAELDPALERLIESEVLDALELELAKLLPEETQQQQQTAASNITPNSSASSQGVVGSGPSGGAAVGPPKGSPVKSLQGSKNIASRSRIGQSQQHDALATETKDTKNKGAQQKQQQPVSIDDLFDLDAGDLATSYEQTVSAEEGDVPQGINEFASELLYIMKTSRQLT